MRMCVLFTSKICHDLSQERVEELKDETIQRGKLMCTCYPGNTNDDMPCGKGGPCRYVRHCGVSLRLRILLCAHVVMRACVCAWVCVCVCMYVCVSLWCAVSVDEWMNSTLTVWVVVRVIQ